MFVAILGELNDEASYLQLYDGVKESCPAPKTQCVWLKTQIVRGGAWDLVDKHKFSFLIDRIKSREEGIVVLLASSFPGYRAERIKRECLESGELVRFLSAPDNVCALTGLTEWLGVQISWVGHIYPVWFGTNRRPTGADNGFSGERHDSITRGRVDVYVPDTHRFGETGTSVRQRKQRGDLRDDHLCTRRVTTQERDEFFTEIRQVMQSASEVGALPHALVYLHGFNVTFEQAAIRAAQLGCDLKVTGATAIFSWPSCGNLNLQNALRNPLILLGYTADEASIEASEQAITEFLVDFSINCGAEKVHIIAHSMGNRGLLRALQRIAANAETQGRIKFGQVFLAAPDVDRDLFLDLAQLYVQHADRTTLYASAADRAVYLSKVLHQAPRAGYFQPYTVVAGVDTVAVPDFNVEDLGHSYYAQAEALLYDIYDLIRHDEAPERRQRLKPVSAEGVNFWEFRQ